MSICIFTGPTLSASAVRSELADAHVFGPVAFGDVCRATSTRPRAIGIIDGYFDRIPAVWHKEILWAMSEGVRVFGASSMGALRAAELADFGMEGVGLIYDSLRRGEIEDDDEVAIVHASEEDGFVALSEAMVNIRATLLAAFNDSIISQPTVEILLTAAKRRFYAERRYTAILLDGAEQGADAGELEALRSWLPTGRVDQKRIDALALVRRIRGWLAQGGPPMRANYRFEHSDAWEEASRIALADVDGSGLLGLANDEAMVEELKLAGTFRAATDGAAARAAAIDQARRAGVRPDDGAIRAAADEMRRSRGLFTREAFERWRSAQNLDDANLPRFLENQARVAWARPLTDAAARTQLVDYLRLEGQYGKLAEHARAKAKKLAALGSHTVTLQDVRATEASLWEWYFGERLGRSVPDDLDRFARSAGFAGKDDMRAAVLRDRYCSESIPRA